MDLKDTAIILIGYQNDYFANDGVLHGNIESPGIVLCNTLMLLDELVKTDILIITTPIIFTPNYSELDEPVGILKIIKDVGAFKTGTKGAKTLDKIKAYGKRIIEIPGKLGLNAFSRTKLNETLQSHNIKNVVFAGAVTSICIDSTGRSAFEKGYNVIQLSDCTSARTQVEQDFYCNIVFPIYSKVMSFRDLLKELGL